MPDKEFKKGEAQDATSERFCLGCDLIWRRCKIAAAGLGRRNRCRTRALLNARHETRESPINITTGGSPYMREPCPILEGRAPREGGRRGRSLLQLRRQRRHWDKDTLRL